MYCPDFAIFATKNSGDKAGVKAADKEGKK
jgi:hypothetical protein